jgi:two-component system response regulator
MRESTVLLVEDNPSDEALSLQAHRKSNPGNDVVVMRDGAEALDRRTAAGQLALARVKCPDHYAL